jgi:pyruvate/2-oxoglutarate dehydrogenase complex dihydrolipoamide acyltransferase (E2) component
VDIPHSNIRKVTAKNMVHNKNSNPHYYVTMEINMDELIAIRKKANELLGAKISVNDYIIKAAALALKEVRRTSRAAQAGRGTRLSHPRRQPSGCQICDPKY